MPLFDHFDLLAPIYENFVTPPEPERLVDLINLPAGGRLLDAGGGTGRVSQVLRDKFSAVVVADLSIGMLREAAHKRGLITVRSMTESLPFASQSFDRIIMVDAIHHVYDQWRTAKELWRVVKPGGRIVFEEPDIRSFVVKLVALMEKVALMRSHFLSPEGIAALFAYPDVRKIIERQGITAWIVIDKE